MGRWARRWKRTVISRSAIATSAGMSMIAKDQARLGVVVASHAGGHATVETGGEDEERHVKVDLEADR